MLSTKNLEKYVKNEINSRLADVTYGNVFFKKGTASSVEGTYIFTKNKEYHILYTEKGEVRSDIVTCDEREVLWHALIIISIRITSQYAKHNREPRKDFRRALFKKEIEIFALFGEDFKKRKTEEIEEILKYYPYVDI